MTKNKRPTKKQRHIEMAADLSQAQSQASVATRTLHAAQQALRSQVKHAVEEVLGATVALLVDPGDVEAQKRAERAWRDYAVIRRVVGDAFDGEYSEVWNCVRQSAGPALEDALTESEEEDRGYDG